jgi:hypothetical protein
MPLQITAASTYFSVFSFHSTHFSYTRPVMKALSSVTFFFHYNKTAAENKIYGLLVKTAG